MTDIYRLVFPDGREVKLGELGEWYEALCADPETDEDERALAAEIVARIRARLN